MKRVQVSNFPSLDIKAIEIRCEWPPSQLRSPQSINTDPLCRTCSGWRSAAVDRVTSLDAILERGPEAIAQQGVADKIDLDLAFVKQFAATLEARRVACRASILVSRLPVEILGEIMAYVVAIWPPQANLIAGTRRESSIGWMSITHVCRRWRTVALEMPMLWTKHTCILAAAAPSMLERARDLPIDMICDCDNHTETQWPTIFQFCLSNFHKAKTLYLCFEDEDYDRIAAAIGSRPLPHLESIQLGCWIDTSRDRVFDAPYLVAPKLRIAILDGGFIPWDPSALYHLSTDPTDNTEDQMPSPERLVTLVRDSCNLRTLELVDWIPSTMLAFQDRTLFASLSHLECLRLTSSPRRCMALMSYLSFPKSVRIVLELCGYEEDGDTYVVPCSDILKVITFLRSRVKFTLAPTRLLFSTIDPNAWLNVSFRMCAFVPPTDDDTDEIPSYPFENGSESLLDIRTPNTPFTASDFLAICYRAHRDLLLDEIKTLELDRLGNYTTHTWSELFQLFPRIESLHIRTGCELSNFLAPLIASTTDRPFFPLLDHIHLDLDVPGFESVEDRGRFQLAQFLGIIHARTALGYPLNRVTFRGYQPREHVPGRKGSATVSELLEATGVLQGLAAVVPNIEVD